ncbi:MAG: hypothetical protein KDD40_09775, partial [Bdellovibrionales bacterium]|nr:hypothetical protein [Bdellovibrionales bacterium]
MDKQEQGASRLSNVLWIISLLKRHYSSYLLMLITAFIATYIIHLLYPKYNTSAMIYINSAEDSQLLNRLGKI